MLCASWLLKTPGGQARTMLTAGQFEALAALMGAREPVKSAARAVLVDGQQAAEAARTHDVSPQSVCNSLRRYRKAQSLIETEFGRTANNTEESNN